MKKRILFTTFVCVWLCGNAFAGPEIDSLRIIPANPNSNEAVQIIAHSSYPCTLCFMLSSEVGINGTVVSVKVAHLYGINCYPMMCHPIDTISIGILDAGEYTLHFELVCDTNAAIVYDHDSLFFTVHRHTGLKPGIQQPELIIEPNPAKDRFSVHIPGQMPGLSNNMLLQVYDMHGRLHHSLRQHIENNRLEINTTNWPEGLYVLRLVTEGAVPLRSKVMVVK